MFLFKTLKGFLALCSVVTGVSLLLGILAVYCNPTAFLLPAFFGLSFPILYILNLLLLGIALIRSKRWAIFHAALALIGAFQISHFVNFLPGKHGESEQSVKIASFNVRGFNRWQWIEEVDIEKKIEAMLLEEKCDIICFQEFHVIDDNDLRYVKGMGRRLGLKYFAYNVAKATNNISGLVIFSRYPLSTIYRENFHKGDIGGNGVLICDAKIDKDKKVRVINMHLESIRFEAPDYEYAEDPTSDNAAFKVGGIRILSRFSRAYKLRSAQAKLIADHIEKSENPVVLAGDANDTPISYSYHTFSKGMEDTFDKGGIGTGSTYAGSLPSFRIDYIMHSKKMETLSHKVIKNEKLSDHYPVVAEIGY